MGRTRGFWRTFEASFFICIGPVSIAVGALVVFYGFAALGGGSGLTNAEYYWTGLVAIGISILLAFLMAILAYLPALLMAILSYLLALFRAIFRPDRSNRALLKALGEKFKKT